MPSSGESLAVIAAGVAGRILGDRETIVTDVTHDSRRVHSGTLFVAVRGFNRDGHDFVDHVAASGAAAVMVDHQMPVGIPQLVVADTRRSMGTAAAIVFGRPAERMSVIGVTGTNGKTSVAHMIESVMAAVGRTCGVVGTLGIRVGSDTIPSERTTPEASDLQRILAVMVERGADAAAVEVSSHALTLGRVDGTSFAVVAFTNLSRDHLDFHGDMESYFLAKTALFEPGRARRAVIDVDDSWGRRLAEMVELPTLTVSMDPSGGGHADLTARVVSADFGGSTMAVGFGGETIEARVPIAGRFSVSNALVAVGCCLALGMDVRQSVAGLATIEPIPGRFELVSGDDPVTIVVDYSHTPAGIEAAIATARPLTTGRIIAVVGAGGDRDRDKRPLMGRAASAADLVVVTSDNPRSEPPGAIMSDVMQGVSAEHESIEDRRLAIRRAIEAAEPGDTVLVMGKGHEAYQEIDGTRFPFHDRTVARDELAAMRGRRT